VSPIAVNPQSGHVQFLRIAPQTSQFQDVLSLLILSLHRLWTQICCLPRNQPVSTIMIYSHIHGLPPTFPPHLQHVSSVKKRKTS
jgi:hypothetical protein